MITNFVDAKIVAHELAMFIAELQQERAANAQAAKEMIGVDYNQHDCALVQIETLKVVADNLGLRNLVSSELQEIAKTNAPVDPEEEAERRYFDMFDEAHIRDLRGDNLDMEYDREMMYEPGFDGGPEEGDD